MLALPQPHHRRLIRRIHAQVKSANPLDRHNLARSQPIDACDHRIIHLNRYSIRTHQPNPRPAIPARIRLRMESSVRRIVILRLASRAHREPRHRSLRPVIRNPPRNREPRPAIGAIQKRIPEPPVLRIQQLPQTILASRRIRRYPRRHAPNTSLATIRNSASPTSPPTPAPSPNQSAPKPEPPLSAASETPQPAPPHPQPQSSPHPYRSR